MEVGIAVRSDVYGLCKQSKVTVEIIVLTSFVR